jgi:hypothetical protein
MFEGGGAHFRIDSPAGASGFQNRSRAVQPNMADLSFAGFDAVVNFPVLDQSAADAAAQGDVEHGVQPNAGAVGGLAKSGCVGVVIYDHWDAGEFGKPFDDWKIGPPLDLVGAAGAAAFIVHRAGEPDAYCRRFGGWPKDLRNAQLDLRSDARSAVGFDDIKSHALPDMAVPVACDDLQLGAADFDANVQHAVRLAWNQRAIKEEIYSWRNNLCRFYSYYSY